MGLVGSDVGGGEMGVGGGAEGLEPRRVRASSSSSSRTFEAVVGVGAGGESVSEEASSQESARGTGAGLRLEGVVRFRVLRAVVRSGVGVSEVCRGV